MTEAPDDSDSVAPAEPTAPTESSKARARRRPTVLGVAGEILITAGVLVLLFLGWQVWWNSLVLAGQQTAAAGAQSQQFLKHVKVTPSPTPTASASPGTTKPDYGTPPVMQPVADYQPFAVIYIPRLGANWKRVIRETVDEDRVLNSYTSGVGHYSGTQMPGQVGNFAVAGHDTGYGNAFVDISDLQLGDAIYVQTKDGWYTYRFRNFEYVQPTQVSVLLPVPREPNAKAVNRIMTITSCNPPYHAAERIVAYNLFDSWQPLSAGPPAAIAAEVAAQGG
jgi:sortase A